MVLLEEFENFNVSEGQIEQNPSAISVSDQIQLLAPKLSRWGIVGSD
jgi:hypothetical protein